eukprot:GHRQ01020825.1.p1 GENE.GHRQ01020825.1~~GHRQ01020825.1.p1  ORF type:complete len:345 (+),score=116.75 GHRQ01020825.1:376-1410(+)
MLPAVPGAASNKHYHGTLASGVMCSTQLLVQVQQLPTGWPHLSRLQCTPTRTRITWTHHQHTDHPEGQPWPVVGPYLQPGEHRSRATTQQRHLPAWQQFPSAESAHTQVKVEAQPACEALLTNLSLSALQQQANSHGTHLQHQNFSLVCCAGPQTTYQTSHGQLLDLTTAPPGSINLSRYTMDAYLRIVTYKTAFYTFYLPVAAGLVLAGEARPAAFELAKSICVAMGQYFQIQDDYLDCYGDPAVIGKIGTDVEDAKCCWLVCTALQEASAEQKEVIKANYGQKDPAAVARVKEVYEQLGLAGKFEAYEAESHASLAATIEEQTLLPKQVFSSLLAKIYKRQK